MSLARKLEPKGDVRSAFEALIHGALRFDAKQYGVQVYLCEVTPAKAEAVLRYGNTDNRRIRQTKVGEYSRYMKRGDWMVRGTLEFMDSGRLHDGQHRLLAVVDSGVTSKFLVQVLPEGRASHASQFTDIGVSRTLGDYLHFNKVADAYRAAGLLIYEKNSRISAGNPFQRADYERKEYLDLYREIGEGLVQAAFSAVPSALHRKLGIQKAFCDWFAFQLIQIDQEAAHLFLQYVASPENLRKTDPMFVLHERLTEVVSAPNARGRRGRQTVSTVEQATMMVKAWNLYFEQQPATAAKLRYRVNEEFPAILGGRPR